MESPVRISGPMKLGLVVLLLLFLAAGSVFLLRKKKAAAGESEAAAAASPSGTAAGAGDSGGVTEAVAEAVTVAANTPAPPAAQHPSAQIRVRGVKRSLRARDQAEAPDTTNSFIEDYDVTDDLSGAKIVNVAPDGSCFFHCVRLALRDGGVAATVRDLRAIVARSVDKGAFEMLRSIYDDAKSSGQVELLRDYGFMRGVKTLAGLRARIMTDEYWGDDMAIRAVEKFFSVQCLVVLVKNRRLFLASQLAEPSPPAPPKAYFLVLLHQEHQHYELVQIDGRRIMSAAELPAKVWRLVEQRKKLQPLDADTLKKTAGMEDRYGLVNRATFHRDGGGRRRPVRPARPARPARRVRRARREEADGDTDSDMGSTASSDNALMRHRRRRGRRSGSPDSRRSSRSTRSGRPAAGRRRKWRPSGDEDY